MSASKSGVPLSSFTMSVENEMAQLISGLKTPIYIVFPDEVRGFVTLVFSSTFIEKHQLKFVSKTAIQESKGDNSLVLITPPNPEVVTEFSQKFKIIPNYTKSIFVIPRTNALFDQAIIENGYTAVSSIPSKKNAEIYLAELHADFFDVEDSFFLLPCINSFSRIFIQHEMSDLFAVARALAKIQAVFGPSPQVITCGQNAEKVNSLMKGIMNQCSIVDSAVPQIDTIVLFDRVADMITPFLTYGTAEQVLDDVYGIDFGVMKYNAKLFKMTQDNEAFASYRSLNLSGASKNVSTFIDEFKKTNEKIRQLRESNFNGTLKTKDFVKDSLHINKMTSLNHLYEQQIDFISSVVSAVNTPQLMSIFNSEFNVLNGVNVSLLEEHLISMFNDWEHALRLMCMESVSGVSHSDKFVYAVQREAVAEFGASAMESMLNLERLGLLSSSPYFYKFQSLKNDLKLIEEGKEESDGSTSYKDPIMKTLSGFCPLSVRIAERAMSDPIKLASKQLNAPQCRLTINGEKPKRVEGEVRRILFFFIGGVTLTEAGMIRSLGLDSNGKFEFLIGGTDKINGKTLIEQICPCIKQQTN